MNIEKVILDYLKLQDYKVPCYMERPQKPPTEYILLQKTGSRRQDLIITTTFAVQSYSTSLYNASELNIKVKKAMDEADTLSGVSASELVSDYNYTDTASKQYRYQAVYEVTHKE